MNKKVELFPLVNSARLHLIIIHNPLDAQYSCHLSSENTTLFLRIPMIFCYGIAVLTQSKQLTSNLLMLSSNFMSPFKIPE